MKKIAIIGCGNMGEALLKGLLDKNLFNKSHIIISEAKPARRDYIKKAYYVSVKSSNAEAAAKSDIVIIAVKPQEMEAVLENLRSMLKTKLTVSIAAGITTACIKSKTSAARIVRAMPNTPALVGCGITAVSYSKEATVSDIKIADKIFSCVGEVVHLEERHINAATAVSGSGPAYFFLLMEVLAKAAVSLGIKADIAERLVIQTAFGAAVLQRNTDIHPSELRRRVTSKGGTTEAALNVFRKRGFQKIVEDALRAAANRAEELSR